MHKAKLTDLMTIRQFIKYVVDELVVRLYVSLKTCKYKMVPLNARKLCWNFHANNLDVYTCRECTLSFKAERIRIYTPLLVNGVFFLQADFDCSLVFHSEVLLEGLHRGAPFVSAFIATIARLLFRTVDRSKVRIIKYIYDSSEMYNN